MKEQNNWRDQLKNRKISPSDEAWLNVESGLEMKSKNKLKRNFIFSLVAASLIGFVVFVSLPSTSIQNQSQAIAVENLDSPYEESVFPEALFLEPESVLNLQETVVVKHDIDEKKNTSNPKNVASKQTINAKESQLQTNTNTKVKAKAAQLLAEVEAELAKPFSYSTKPTAEDEADLLLAEAKQIIQELEYDKLYEFAQASELLAEAEDDLTKDKLQNRVWHFVKSNFQNLENALVSLR